jgi:hypothetical protein
MSSYTSRKMLLIDQVYLFHINSSYDRTDDDVSDCHGFVNALNNQQPTVEGKHSITLRVQYFSIVKKPIFRNLQVLVPVVPVSYIILVYRCYFSCSRRRHPMAMPWDTVFGSTHGHNAAGAQCHTDLKCLEAHMNMKHDT